MNHLSRMSADEPLLGVIGLEVSLNVFDAVVFAPLSHLPVITDIRVFGVGVEVKEVTGSEGCRRCSHRP